MDRDLSPRGLREARDGAAWIDALAPDWIIASPARRASITAATVAGERHVQTIDRLYDASLATLLDVIQVDIAKMASAASRVLVVAHNPGLSELVTYLSGDERILAPASLVRLAMPASWNELSSGSAQMLEWRTI